MNSLKRLKHSSPGAQPFHLHTKSELFTIMSMTFSQNVRKHFGKHKLGRAWLSSHFFPTLSRLETSIGVCSAVTVRFKDQIQWVGQVCRLVLSVFGSRRKMYESFSI